MTKRNKQSNDDEELGMKEFSTAIMQIAEEKGIPKDKVIETVEAALSAAYKKDYGKRGQHIRAEFNEVDGKTKFFLVKEVVDETTREFVDDTEDKLQTDAESRQPAQGGSAMGGKDTKKEKEGEGSSFAEAAEDEEKLPRFNPERDITLEEAKKVKKKIKVGDVIESKLESKSEFGRVAAQTAKQVIIQRIREAERDAMFKEYKEKEGEVISGVVQRIEGRNVYIDLGKSIGVLFPSEQIEGERYRIGQRVKVYLAKVEADPKGPGILLSRTHPEMIQKLFELEVPEIFAKTVEIKAIAREAGSRTKLAVSSNEEGVDPIGSCVGQKGTRVQAVIDELGGEKIDIIGWDDKPDKFIAAALSPAKVLSVELDEEKKETVVKVPEDQLSLAIGKQGQNVRLAAKLSGYRIDVVGDAQNNPVKADDTSANGASAEKDEEGAKENKSKEEVKEGKKEKTKKARKTKKVKEEKKEEKK